MSEYGRSASGRWLAASVGVALAGGGAAAVAGPIAALPIVGIAFPVAVALGVVAVALSANDFFTHGIVAGLGLPVLLLLYALGLGLVIGYVPVLGYAMIVGGLGLLSRAFIPPRAPQPLPAKYKDTADAHG